MLLWIFAISSLKRSESFTSPFCRFHQCVFVLLNHSLNWFDFSTNDYESFPLHYPSPPTFSHEQATAKNGHNNSINNHFSIVFVQFLPFHNSFYLYFEQDWLMNWPNNMLPLIQTDEIKMIHSKKINIFFLTDCVHCDFSSQKSTWSRSMLWSDALAFVTVIVFP